MSTINLLEVNTPAFDELVKSVAINTIKVVMEEMQGQKEIWLVADQACEFMNISVTTLTKYRDEPGSPIIASKPGKDVLYLKSSLHAYLIGKSNKKLNP